MFCSSLSEPLLFRETSAILIDEFLVKLYMLKDYEFCSVCGSSHEMYLKCLLINTIYDVTVCEYTQFW